MNRITTLGLLALAISANVSAKSYTASEHAIKLSKENLIIDTHIDVPYRLEKQWQDVTKSAGGDFDYPRAVEGGLNAPFMSIYIPAHLEKTGGSYEMANRLIDSMEALVGRAPNKFAIADSVADITKQFEQGKMSLAMGMENGSPIEGKLKNLNHFFDRGIRYITLTHSQTNHISDSSYDLRRQWNGLSKFGKELVVEMNNLGMMIDVSHISDDAFYQVMDISKVPVIASHSSLRKYTPGFERNMDDKMLLALKDNNGVIQINFGSSFVTSAAGAWSKKMKAKRTEAQDKHGKNSSQVKGFKKTFAVKNPYPFATTEQVIEHINHVVKLIGIDHVGIGSDFDGVGDSLPVGLKDVSDYPNLVQGLIEHGYSDKDIKKILSGNLLRVWQQVEKYAAKN